MSGKSLSPAGGDLTEMVVGRAENLFRIHGLSCAESVLLTVNRGFKGGLATDQALALASGFGGGVGGAGGLCGAVSGAVMALGLMIGPGSPAALSKKKFRRLIIHLQEDFAARAGTIECRELLREYRVIDPARKRKCAGLTGLAARLTTARLLEARPETIDEADLVFLRGEDTRFSLLINKILGRPML